MRPPLLIAAALFLLSSPAGAQLRQPDGAAIPAGNTLDNAINTPPLNEGIDVRNDASLVPEVFTPAQVLTFRFIAEGAGYENAFGWYNLGDDVSNPANRHIIFTCDVEPENPFVTRQVDFCQERAAGRWRGGPIGFFLITPERVDGGGRRNPNCAVNDNVGYIYYSEPRLNLEDPVNPYIHHLVYRSNRIQDAFYFGFEDLFRGGDNDFEDALVLVEGLLVGDAPEVCDGADDDCDGRVDEGADRVCESACGVGVQVCNQGGLGACTAPEPAAEQCNGVDDDCDGALDEGLTRACASDCGAGVEVCIAGAWAGCTAPQPRAEGCDNVDNDCDGSVDEGLRAPCANGCGVAGETRCVAGSFVQCDAPAPVAELCNGLDDDCDGVVDENLRQACQSACGQGLARCVDGAFVDCSAPAPGEEVCNGADDDCDGTVDEALSRPCDAGCGEQGVEQCVGGAFVACSARAPLPERCNGIDDDCDGATDESLDRACVTACGEGRQACVGGAYSACDAPLPEPEQCDAVDQDCDGNIDEGLTQACRSACGDGVQQCVLGQYGDCDAPEPVEETCDGTDDDCDGAIDEQLEQACDSACGIGTEICVEGAWGGCTALDPIEETCNGLDDDCDGTLDEQLMRPCQTPCGEGMQACEGGRWSACPAAAASPEVCDGQDNDCDGVTDEMVECPGESACVRGVCADPCQNQECPPGLMCEGGYCIEEPCRACRAFEICRADACVDPCAETDCAEGEYCREGACEPGDCVEGGCDPGKVCVGGACLPDDCDLINCAAGFGCRLGQCFATCVELPCAADERCIGGMCMIDPCAGVQCDDGQRCADGECEADPCAGQSCAAGEVCAGGACAEDPCLAARCPTGSTCAVAADGEVECRPDVPDPEPEPDPEPDPCDGGVCDGGPPSPEPTPAVDDESCRAAPGDGPSDGAWLLLLVIPLALRRRRGLALLAGLTLLGCVAPTEVEPGTPDGGGTVPVDPGCLPFPETCNGEDDDCNGIVDDVDDLDRDPQNCGACGVACDLPFAVPACLGGQCRVRRCEPGRVDDNGRSADGCEAICPGVEEGLAEEICNGADDDCDGTPDEGFDLGSDIENCGVCGRACLTARVASAMCLSGRCSIAECEEGWINLDGRPENGCELPCGTPGADEACNGADDDCDGVIDEMVISDVQCRGEGLCRGSRPACGPDGITCSYPEGVTDDGELRCDGQDEDCDGEIDEDFEGLGEPCDGDDDDACANGTVVCSPDRAGTVCREVRRGRELCDGADNDCDELVDEGFDLDTDTANCGRCGVDCNAANAEGVCAAGVCSIEACAAGFVDLDGATANGCEYPCAGSDDGVEVCNGRDDDCDGTIDEGVAPPPEAACADVGVCAATRPVCQGAEGFVCPYPLEYEADRESRCDGLDNDCDGTIDEDFDRVGALCDGDDDDACPGGVVACAADGAGVVCTDDAASVAEICDGADNDCDGEVDENYDLEGDVDNCGACNARCDRPGAVVACLDGVCSVAGCQPGFYDANGLAIDGCEYACAEVPGDEICDGVDNDCNGLIDDGLPPPAMGCGGPGLCTGLVAVCAGADGFECPYPAAHEPVEFTCDDLDNDCDGAVDESGANPGLADKGEPCQQGRGACLRRGVLVCDADGQQLRCTAEAGQPAGEVCNGIDDDCDGTVDEEIPRGEEMVRVDVDGRRIWIDRWEASRPDARADALGLDTSRACSRSGVQPWVNVTHADALAACRARGKRLCTDREWARSCGGAYPYGGAYDPAACNTAGGAPEPTGSRAGCQGPEGTFDMSGNVAEWAECTNEVDCRVVRPVLGGSFVDRVESLWRCDFRGNGAPQVASGAVGFRCCVDD